MVTMIPVTKFQIWWGVRRLFFKMVDSIFHWLISNTAVAAGSNTKRHKTRHDHHSNQGRQLDHLKINV